MIPSIPTFARHGFNVFAGVIPTSVTVPTVERGFLLVVFCSMEMAGERPSMESTSGFCMMPGNWRAYEERDSTYRRWPSA